MSLADVLGRAGDVSQLALGAGLLRPIFQRLRSSRPGFVERMRHEPFAAKGDAFVREVGLLEKAGFVAKMLGTDGGWRTRNEPARRHAPEAIAEQGQPEMLFAGDVLFPGVLDADSLSFRLRARISQASVLVANLEGTLGDEPHELAPLLTLRGITQLLAYEKDPTNTDWVSRIDRPGLRALLDAAPRALVSVANNHTLDDGIEGFDRTLSLLDRAGVGVIGDARKDEGAVRINVGPHCIGLFAMSYGSNQSASGSDCHLRFNDVPYRLEHTRLVELVDRLRACGATHVVAILHWGYEHEHEPAPEQERCAERLFEAGVSAVIGHHPHLLQRSDASAGRWISYSLGDFIGGDRTIWSRFAMMVSLRFGEGGSVCGESIPIVQTPFWRRHQTMLLADAPAFERVVFDRWFARKIPCTAQGSR